MITFKNERELQETFGDFLESLGHAVTLEITTAEGRIDILTNQYLIECKHHLNRKNGYEAIGQLVSYSAYYPHHQKIIVCESVDDEQSRSRAMLSGIRVIATNENHRFQSFLIQHYGDSLNPEFKSLHHSRRRFAYDANFWERNRPRLVAVVGVIVLLAGAALVRINGVSESRTQISSAQFVRVATSNGEHLNLRSGPGIQHAVILTLPDNSPLILLDDTSETGWFLVQTERGIKGYILGDQVMY
ncbi:MAG: SH3 domain-containing protein [Leptolyngbyaceae cyanobacterium MO_188.B28]|nr:SH3 domain-containing protein [Leptolyngbyaceae cyanobacterium MO_188.B28]